MKASERELVVHRAVVDGAPGPKEEAFLTAGKGSFFVSRVGELVVLEPTPDGVAGLPAKVEQLVDRGLHNVVLDLGGLSELGDGALKALGQVKEVLDRCDGALRLCRVPPEARRSLAALDGDGLKVHDDVDAAVAECREQLAAEEGPEAEAVPNSEWGWGSDEQLATPAEETPPVAELLVEDAELPRLPEEVRGIVGGSGKRHVSLRLHFGRPIASEDVNVLTAVRDYLAAEGGQLVLVSLQQEVLKWLELLEFDREFVIVETADEADAAHRAHAAGASPPPAARTSPTPSAPTAPSASGTTAPAAGETELARTRAEAEVLRRRVHQLEDEAHRAKARTRELEGELRRKERRVRELEQALATAEDRAVAAERASGEEHEEVARLQQELAALRKQLDGVHADAAERERNARASASEELARRDERIGELRADLADAERRSGELSAALAEARAEAESLRKQLDAVAEGEDDVAALRRRCVALEDEKAKILAEAEAEIRRLSEERAALHQELESAGELIERLGKELELS